MSHQATVTDEQIRAALRRVDSLCKYDQAQTIRVVAQSLRVAECRVRAIYSEGYEE